MASLFARQLHKLEDYPTVIRWVGDREFEEAWAICPGGEWMISLAEKLEVDSRLFVQIACRCARLVLPWVPEGEERPRKAIEAAEGYLEGKVSVEEVQDASAAAMKFAASNNTFVLAAVWAARTSLDLTWAANCATRIVQSFDGNREIRSQTLSIIREVLTQPVREKLAALEV